MNGDKNVHRTASCRGRSRSYRRPGAGSPTSCPPLSPRSCPSVLFEPDDHRRRCPTAAPRQRGHPPPLAAV